MKIVYLAGPLTNEDEKLQQDNLKWACRYAALLRVMGSVVISPHEMGYHWPQALDYDGWIAHGLTILEKCDEVVLAPGWEESKGCLIEVKHAETMGIPVCTLSDAFSNWSNE